MLTSLKWDSPSIGSSRALKSPDPWDSFHHPLSTWLPIYSHPLCLPVLLLPPHLRFHQHHLLLKWDLGSCRKFVPCSGFVLPLELEYFTLEYETRVWNTRFPTKQNWVQRTWFVRLLKSIKTLLTNEIVWGIWLFRKKIQEPTNT